MRKRDGNSQLKKEGLYNS